MKHTEFIVDDSWILLLIAAFVNKIISECKFIHHGQNLQLICYVGLPIMCFYVSPGIIYFSVYGEESHGLQSKQVRRNER